MRDYTDLLLERGIVSLDQLAEATAAAKTTKMKVGEALVKAGYVAADEVARALADFHKMPFVDLHETRISDQVIELVPESVARENVVIPVSEEDGALRILITDPFDLETIEKLRFILNRKIETAIASRESILEAINQYYGQTEGESADSMLQEFTDTAIDFTETEDSGGEVEEDADESSPPVVRLVKLMIEEAVQLRASDIHVEPFENRVRIRYRIDGILVERDSPPGGCSARFSVVSRLLRRWISPSGDAPKTAVSRSPSATNSWICASASSRRTTVSRRSCVF